MKILSNIENIEGRYHVQITSHGFTANEEDLLMQFGEPLIDVGANFAGSATRPGQANTTISITPVSGGSGATAVAVVDANGVVDAITVISGGSGYGNGANVSVVGDGSGATAAATIQGGIVTAISVTAGGSGYHVVPYSVAFTLPPELRRIRTDSPFVQVFDLNDTPDADVWAKVWSDSIMARLTAAKTGLLTQSSAFVGESMITV